MNKYLKSIIIGLGIVHLIGWGISSIYYEWEYKNKNTVIASYFLSNYAGTIKGFFWEYHLYKNLKDENLENHYNSLSEQEILRIKELVITAMRNEDADIEALKREYWSILSKVYGNDTEQATKDMLGFMGTEQMDYGKYFWMDAMMSYKQGRLYMSNELLYLEEDMRKNGVMPQARIDYNHDMLTKIALQEPIIIDGQKVIFNEDMIQAGIDNSDGAIQRFKNLIYY